MIKLLVPTLLSSALLVSSAFAQSEPPQPSKEPLRVRVGLGGQVGPRFPGSDDMTIKPYWDFSFTRGSKPFTYEAPDESVSFQLLRAGSFEAGPAANLESKRRRKHVGAAVDEVGTTVEVGGFAQVWLGKSLRIRAEARQGIGGHRSLVGAVSADAVIRDGDKYVVSIGPRLSLSDSGYQDAFFGVSPGAAARTGLPVYRPGSGIYAVGVASGMTYSFNERWGMMGYAKYDRLTGDAGRSPLIRAYGKRDQFSAGLGLTYTFGRIVR